MPNAILVYVEIESRVETCEGCGSWFVRVYYGQKYLRKTAELLASNNGYEDTIEPVYVDAQGRKWDRRSHIAYSGKTRYVCRVRVGNRWFSGTVHKPHNGVRVDLRT